jgi:2-dehydro-3-deoxygluconokinase
MRILCIGECMVELALQENGDYHRSFAGDTFNTAVYLARENSLDEVCYFTSVGDDEISREMLTEMQQQGLNTKFIQRSLDKTVGLYMIQTDSVGERSFSYWRSDSAARKMFATYPPAALLEAISPDLIYLSGISLAILPDHDRQSLLDCLGGLAVPVAFDPNYRPRLWQHQSVAQAACVAAAGAATYLLTTLDDDQRLWGLSTMDEAMVHWQSITNAELVIKNGPGPVRLSHSVVTEVLPVAVPTPIDTTGAGDAFNAVYLSNRLKGVSPELAVSAANQFCAEVVMCRGAILPG